MAAVEGLAAGQNCSDLDHGRVGEVGKKNEVERNPFYRLPLLETHHGSRNLAGKMMTVVCSWHKLVPADWVPQEGAM
jgi:hypothetical protein